jgi:predicted DNA-binding protein (MmcQ/YjbR family)
MLMQIIILSKENRGISLEFKPEPEIEHREQHSEVTPAYHFNKVIY